MKNFYRLIQGDCLKVLSTLESKSVDFTVTSPPFKDEDVLLEYYEWFNSVLKEIDRVTKQCSLIFNSSIRLIEICRRFNPERVLIWAKHGSKCAYRYEPIFMFNHGSSFKLNGRIWSDCHIFQPTLKPKVPYTNPLKLYLQIIKMISRENEVVLDPFLGGGTSMDACLNLNRSCIGIEINPEYCENVRKRCFGRQFLDHEATYSFEVSKP